MQPGLGKALALTRESTQFRQIQENFRAHDAAVALESADSQLTAIAEMFGESAGKVMVPYGHAERWAMISVKVLYLAARFLGYSFFVSPTDVINPDPVVDDLASNHAARLAGEMVHIVRSGAFSRAVGEQVRRALTVRSSAIQLSSGSGKTQGNKSHSKPT
jgi:hypothetical protein